MKRAAGLLVVAALSLGGCHLMTSSTRVESVQSEKPSAVTLQKVLVFGINVSDESRLPLERAFAKALAAPGRTLVQSSDWYPDGKLPTREVIAARVQAEGVTGVLVTRLMDYAETTLDTDGSEQVLFIPPQTSSKRSGCLSRPRVVVICEGNAVHWVTQTSLPPAAVEPMRPAVQPIYLISLSKVSTTNARSALQTCLMLRIDSFG